jgi:NitT/TauT family transport system permease protein
VKGLAAGTGRRNATAPLVVGLIGLGLWQGLLSLFHPAGFVLPPPLDIAARLVDNWSKVAGGLRVTGLNAVIGLIAGVALGALAALTVTAWRTASEMITPLAVAVNAIPIIALAPIFDAWFGLTSPRSHQAVVVVLVFFPVFVNSVRGLSQVEESQLELMASYAASRWRVIREVRIPNALPYFFTALKLSSSLAVIGSIVAEYFGGRQDALGPIITQNAGLTRYAEAWGAVVAGSALGAVFYGLAVWLEWLLVPWNRGGAGADETP